MKAWVHLLGFKTQKAHPAQHRGARQNDREVISQQLPANVVKPFASLPVTTHIELITKRDKRLDL
jgi:hypothetical protein